MSVVLYHGDILPGGFVGVDVFFVISGYLISQILLRELRDGQFSIAAFYERRVRRLLPALFAVLAASTLAASYLFYPARFAEFSKSMLATLFFVSNLFFFRDTEDYFASGATTKPLLHTWSLAVEEQFYIFFPIALWAAYRYLDARKAVIALLAVLSASFVTAAWGYRYDPNAAFYLPWARAWELLLGVLLSLVSENVSVARAQREILGVLGLGATAWSLLQLRGDWSPMSAVAPCIAAAMLILAGGQSLVSRCLAFRPLVFIGLVSYSWYLWHWPVLVFTASAQGGSPGWQEYLVLQCFAFGLAAASWRWIERPFRTKAVGRSRRTLFLQATAAAAGAAAFSAVALATDGLPLRFGTEALALDALASGGGPKWTPCVSADLDAPWTADACRYGARVRPTWAVWGDSEAGALAPGIGALAAQHGQSVELFAHAACPPLTGFRYVDEGKENAYHCTEFNRSILAFLQKTTEIRGVILVGRHQQYLLDSSREHYEALLRETVSTLTGFHRTVVLVYPTPETEQDVQSRLLSMLRRGERLEDWTLSQQAFMNDQREAFEALDSIPDSIDVVKVYPHRLLCDGAACLVSADGRPLYSDGRHLSSFGAARVSPVFHPAFSRLAPG